MLLVLLLSLFFVDGPDRHASRHLKAFWNLGHILFFALLPYYLFSCRKWLAGRFAAQCAFALGICVSLGILIELLQYNFQRTPDSGDILRDVFGGLVGIFFFLDTRKRLKARVLIAFQIITIGLMGLQVYPILAALADEYLARGQFPVLSSFETPWEVARWQGNAAYSIDSDIHMEGRSSLRVLLGTSHYSGVRLEYFPENWAGVQYFRFSVYNPSNQELPLTCRIHDPQHEKNRYRYSDRFNRRYSLPPGWTTIDIPTSDIRDAPRGRRMDMEHVCEVGFFATDLLQPQVVYIDDVRLVLAPRAQAVVTAANR